MKTKVENASIEEIIREVSCWEDMDTVVMLMPTEDGQMEITDYNQTSSVIAPTVKEALIRFNVRSPCRNFDDEDYNLDWSTALEWLNGLSRKE